MGCPVGYHQVVHPSDSFSSQSPWEEIPDSNMEVKGTHRFMLEKLTLFG